MRFDDDAAPAHFQVLPGGRQRAHLSVAQGLPPAIAGEIGGKAAPDAPAPVGVLGGEGVLPGQISTASQLSPRRSRQLGTRGVWASVDQSIFMKLSGRRVPLGQTRRLSASRGAAPSRSSW